MITTCTNDLFSLEKRFSFSSISKAWCEQIWSEHKYWVMLRSYRRYKELSKAFRLQNQEARINRDHDWTSFASYLLDQFEEIGQIAVEEESARNALQHVFGHINNKVTQQESGSWHLLLATNWQEAYRILFLLATEHGDENIVRSRLFSTGCNSSHTWVRFRGKDWFVSRQETGWSVLSQDEVRERINPYQVQDLIHYRLIVEMDGRLCLLPTYEQIIVNE